MVTVYEEEQKFSQWWIWAILGGMFFISAINLFDPTTIKITSFNLTVFILSIILIGLFAFLRLETKISQSEISVKYFPLLTRTIQWEDIESAELIDYGFIGGWGIRLTIKYGPVYNSRGSKGLFIKLKNGKKLVVGTQNEAEMKVYLSKLGKPV